MALDEHHRGGKPFPPAVSTAVALERLRVAHRRSREKHAQYRALAAAFFEMPLDDVRKWVRPRHFEVALMHLGGYDMQTIARACGYKDRVRIELILKRPEIARYIALIREAQEARVIAGEFGVRAAAKAAAPRAMKRIVDDGQEAPKAADRHANNKTVLQVAGELVDRHEHHHVSS